MSSEGDTNLDNDTAGDLIGATSAELFGRVLELIRHPRGHEYDDWEIGELFFKIEMIFALRERGLISGADSMTEIPKEVQPYLAKWKGYHREAGHEPPETRQASIVQTFDQLIEIIEELQSCPQWVSVDLESIPEEARGVLDIFKSLAKESDED